MLQNLKDKAAKTYDSAKQKYNEHIKKSDSKKTDKEEKKEYSEMVEESDKKKEVEELPQADQDNQKKSEQPKLSTFDQIKLQAKNAQNYVKDKIEKVDQKYVETKSKMKKDMNLWVAKKADEKIMNSFPKMGVKISESLKDKNMPQCMKTLTEDAVESLWDDVRDLIRFELRVSIVEPEIHIPPRNENFILMKPWYQLRNWMLYSIFPYDLTFWAKTKKFSFFFWTALQACPYYGIQAFSYFLVFLGIDKSDEYQCVNFILNFKNIQFITSGVLSAIYGYFSYFYCASLKPSLTASDDFIIKSLKNNSKHLNQNNPYEVLQLSYCFKEGPGSGIDITISLVSYFVQVILIWIAYFMMFKSVSRVDFIEEGMKIKKKERGGRLKWFMIYDLLMFLISFGVSASIFYTFYYAPGQVFLMYQQIGGLFYFAKVIYATLSFPFLIFSIEPLIKLFTTAKPTGYDQLGNVIPKINKLKITYANLPIEDDNIELDPEIEMQNLEKPEKE